MIRGNNISNNKNYGILVRVDLDDYKCCRALRLFGRFVEVSLIRCIDMSTNINFDVLVRVDLDDYLSVRAFLSFMRSSAK